MHFTYKAEFSAENQMYHSLMWHHIGKTLGDWFDYMSEYNGSQNHSPAKFVSTKSRYFFFSYSANYPKFALGNVLA